MKSNVIPSYVQMEAKELEKLVSEVKETVATNFHMEAVHDTPKIFGAADMWKLQKNRKSIRVRRTDF